jgi:hypothetical protein
MLKLLYIFVAFFLVIPLKSTKAVPVTAEHTIIGFDANNAETNDPSFLAQIVTHFGFVQVGGLYQVNGTLSAQYDTSYISFSPFADFPLYQRGDLALILNGVSAGSTVTGGYSGTNYLNTGRDLFQDYFIVSGNETFSDPQLGIVNYEAFFGNSFALNTLSSLSLPGPGISIDAGSDIVLGYDHVIRFQLVNKIMPDGKPAYVSLVAGVSHIDFLSGNGSGIVNAPEPSGILVFGIYSTFLAIRFRSRGRRAE